MASVLFYKPSKLSVHLRHLLQCVRDLSTKHPVCYRDCIDGMPPLLQLAVELWDHQEGGSHCNGVQIFALGILKRIFLTQFHLFCACSELQDDVENAFSELRTLCEFVEHYNGRLVSLNCCRRTEHVKLKSMHRLHFIDLVNVLVSCRTSLITEMILQDLTPNNILHVAQFEASFVRAVLGICATYTSLLNNPTHGAQNVKLVFVSEEMFSMVQHSKLTWLDCLIPGAQSEYLRNVCQQLTASLWKKVATELLAQAQPLVLGGNFVQEIVKQLTQAMEHQELEHHTAVIKCLWYTLSAIQHQQALAAWDSGLQLYLATTPVDSRKGFKPSKAEMATTKSTSVLLSHMLPHLDKLAEKPSKTTSEPLFTMERALLPQTLSLHVDALSFGEPVSRAFGTSVNLSASYIIQGLRGALAKWNLRSAAQLLFIDGPRTSTALTQTADTLARTVCPQYTFPLLSSFNTIEQRSRDTFSVAHSGLVYLKEALESFGIAFHDTWSKQCAQFLHTVFPSRKSWKSLGKNQRIHQTKPSSYCDSIIEGLVLPIAEAASGLPQDTQPVFVCLLVCVLMNELKKIITSNECTYTASAGRQLLTDFRHLWHKLTSEELGQVWSQQTLQLLSSLSVVKEVEHGLLILCGTADQLEPSLPADPTPFYSMLPFPNLPIFSELAWYSERDWIQCIA